MKGRAGFMVVTYMINTVAVLCISVVILFDTDIFIQLVLPKGCISLGISFATTEKSLTEAFSPFGKVVHGNALILSIQA